MTIHFFHVVHYNDVMPKFAYSIQGNWIQFEVFNFRPNSINSNSFNIDLLTSPKLKIKS